MVRVLRRSSIQPFLVQPVLQKVTPSWQMPAATHISRAIQTQPLRISLQQERRKQPSAVGLRMLSLRSSIRIFQAQLRESIPPILVAAARTSVVNQLQAEAKQSRLIAPAMRTSPASPPRQIFRRQMLFKEQAAAILTRS